MTLVAPKPSGHAFGEVLTSTQFNVVNTQFPYAVDGNAGGTYAPSAVITIGGSGLSITGASAISAAITASGAGRLRVRYVVGADADTSYGPQTYDIIQTPTMTAARAYTLTNTSAGTGDVMMVYKADTSGYYLTVENHDAATIDTLVAEGDWGQYVYDGSDWVKVSGSKRLHGARYDIDNTATADATKYTISLAARSDTGYTLTSNEVEVPNAGWYLVAAVMDGQSAGTSNPQYIGMDLDIGASSSVVAGFAQRFSATTTIDMQMSFTYLVEITTPSTQKISLVNNSGSQITPAAANGSRLNITKVA